MSKANNTETFIPEVTGAEFTPPSYQVTPSEEREIMQAVSSYNRDNTTGFDLYETAKQLNNVEERFLFKHYEREFLTNDFAMFLVLNLAANLMDFRLESENPEDLQRVREWMYQRDTNQHLHQLLINAFLNGTGIAERFVVGDRLDNFVRVDSSTVQQFKRRGPKGEIRHTYQQIVIDDDDRDMFGRPVQREHKLNDKHVAAFRPIEMPNRAAGISMMRGSLLPLQAIRQLNMDIPAGIKKLAYNTLVMSMDLDDIPEDKQKSAIRRAVKNFEKYDSATNTVMVMDKRHELNYVGTKGSPAGSQIRPILELIEPPLIFLLNKWFIPLGDVLQEKSNRALAQTQTETSRMRLKSLKEKFAFFLEKELISYILGKPADMPTVRVVHNVSLSERIEEISELRELWLSGAISQQLLLQLIGLKEPEGVELIYRDGPLANRNPEDTRPRGEDAARGGESDLVNTNETTDTDDTNGDDDEES